MLLPSARGVWRCRCADCLASVDVKALETGEQLVLYFFPIITNLAFINIAVVAVRLYWFEKRIRAYGKYFEDVGWPG